MRNRFVRILLLSLLFLFIASCTSQPIILKEIPRPTDSPRLRVFVQPLESETRWRTDYRTYAKMTLEKVEKVWFDTGIYEVVQADQVDAVVGTYRKYMPWGKDNYDLAKRAARALWAEYAMLVEREFLGEDYYWSTTLINARTGAVFKVSMNVPGGSRGSYQFIIRASYEQLFKDAKEDMLVTARLKSHSFAGVPPGYDDLPSSPTEVSRNLEFSTSKKEQTAESPHFYVAVYDLDAAVKDELISRILSEAFRFELVSLKRFQLVSRETLGEVLEEMALQQSGLIDEKQAVKVGHGLAAQQIIVGVFGTVGKMSVIQVKRIDVETQKTVGIGSLKCETGKEERLLDGMAGLAAAISVDS